jgi:hypothetical protein
MSLSICQRWPKASQKLTPIQLQVWDMKLSGMSFEKIQKVIADRGEYGMISTSSLRASLGRTAIGKPWRPHAFEGKLRFLNEDEEIALARWVNEEIDGRSMQEFLEAAVYFRYRAIMESAPVLQAMGCPTIVDKLEQEANQKTSTWGYAIAHELNLRVKAPELLETKRFEYGTTTLITRWFAQMLPEVQQMNEAALIFNFDETMLHCVSRGKVIVSGDKKTFRRRAPMGPHMTLGLCVSPTGIHPPPLIILPAIESVTTFAYFESIKLVKICNSQSGWMTSEVFTQWALVFCDWLRLHRLTLPENTRSQTALIYIDNCRSHCSRDALNIFRENNVKVITFPPHVTHILQPIDVSCVRAFKTQLVKESKYFEKHGEEFVMSHSQAERRRVQLVLGALSSIGACNLRVCSNGFRKAGLYPFNQTEALRSEYVIDSAADPEEIMRRNRPTTFHTGSSVMTSDEFLARLNSHLERSA